MLSLEPAVLGEHHRIRLWVLYVNTSSKPVLLEPMTSASLSTNRIGKRDTVTTSPMAASQVLKAISAEKASALIMQAVGGALRSAGAAISASPTTIYGPGGAWTVNNASEKSDSKQTEIGRETGANMEATVNSYDLFSASVSAGILRKTTVFPHTSVNGFLYFPLQDWRTDFSKVG